MTVSVSFICKLYNNGTNPHYHYSEIIFDPLYPLDADSFPGFVSDFSIDNNYRDDTGLGFVNGSYSNFVSGDGTDLVVVDLDATLRYPEYGDSVQYSSLSVSDFYIWESTDYFSDLTGLDIGESFTSQIQFLASLGWSDYPTSFASITGYTVSYSLLGDSTVYTYNHVYDNPDSFTFLNFTPQPSEFYPEADSSTVLYIHDYTLNLSGAFPSFGEFYCTFNEVVMSNVDMRSIDLSTRLPEDSNPALPLRDYTSFLGTGASGFLDLEIFPGFTIGGIFMTLVAFCCVIWFLKLFAGG